MACTWICKPALSAFMHGRVEVRRLPDGHAAVVRVALERLRVRVRLEQVAGVALDHAVGEELHGVGLVEVGLVQGLLGDGGGDLRRHVPLVRHQLSEPRTRIVSSPACASSSNALVVLDSGNSTASCESVMPTGLAIACS